MRSERGEKKREERSRKLGRASRIVIAAAGCLLVAAVSFTVYSKYYKTGFNKGMAVASGFYFSSNYMTELDAEANVKDVEGLKGNQELLNRLHVKASEAAWETNQNDSSANSMIQVEVSNYANQLLYNDKDLNITYNVEFILLDVPQGITYQIGQSTADGGTVTFSPLTADTVAAFSGALPGGKLSWDTYRIQVMITDTKNYTPARILALAYPTAPSYVKDTKKIAGIITTEYQASEMEITEQGFTIEDNYDGGLDAAPEWKTAVKAESALAYRIRTSGNYYGSGENAQRQTIKLTWDPKMYQLNKYDRYRVELEEKYKDDPAGLAAHLNETEGWMIVDILPYSSIKFLFYRAADFETQLNGKDLTAFRESVQAEVINN